MSIETQAAAIPTADLPATTAIINQSNTTNNVNQSNSNPNSNSNSPVSPSKARRRRKRNNKNKNKNQDNKANQNTTKSGSKSNTKSNKKKRQQNQIQNQKSKANPQTATTKLDRVQLSKKGKKNPWSTKQQSSTFENIMNEQQGSKASNYTHSQAHSQLTDEQLLEQQMIAMAIAASKKEQQEQQLKEYEKYANAKKNEEEKSLDKESDAAGNADADADVDTDINDNDKVKIENEDEEKQIIEDNITTSTQIINDELIAASIDAQNNINLHKQTEDQTLSDQALAIQLQQQEQHEYKRRQKMSEIYDGKYAKVTSSAVKATAIPKAALNFYYDDESMLNGGLTKEQYQQHLMTTQASEESIVDENGDNAESAATEQTQVMEEELEAISKHDAKIWSEKHMERLNEYEVGGNLNLDMNIGNQAYNSFRNQLDKKHFITYHNYQLEPAEPKR